MIDVKLERLLIGLEARGYKKHGRATLLKSQTGYAISTISEVLKGSAELTERFTKIVCSAAGISYEWVWDDKGEMFTEERHYYTDSKFNPLSGPKTDLDAPPEPSDIPLEHTLASCGLNPKDIRMVKEWLKMSPADQDEVLKTLSLENLDKGRY